VGDGWGSNALHGRYGRLPGDQIMSGDQRKGATVKREGTNIHQVQVFIELGDPPPSYWDPRWGDFTETTDKKVIVEGGGGGRTPAGGPDEGFRKHRTRDLGATAQTKGKRTRAWR